MFTKDIYGIPILANFGAPVKQKYNLKAFLIFNIIQQFPTVDATKAKQRLNHEIL